MFYYLQSISVKREDLKRKDQGLIIIFRNYNLCTSFRWTSRDDVFKKNAEHFEQALSGDLSLAMWVR